MARGSVMVLTVSLLATAAAGSATGPVSAASPTCNGVRATIVGTDSAELIRGTDRRDVILARGGADKVVARGGNDLVCAGPGNDTVSGGAGADHLFGEDGHDTLKGEAGRDALNGGAGRDGCYSGTAGATLADCEESDLAVSFIVTPTNVSSEVPFSYTVRVRNLGGKPSSAFGLTIDETLTDVVCGYEPASLSAFGTLLPGAYVDSVVIHTNGCHAQESGTDWHMDIEARVQPDVPDLNPANDDIFAAIAITPIQ